ncbi:hypothetical protein FRX31_007038, partial [Thalictrum thalictroides]
MLVQPVSQVISNSNQVTIAPEISCSETQIPNISLDCIATSIPRNQGQLGVVVPAAHAHDNQQGTINVSQGEVPAPNHTTDGVKWSSILGRQAVSKNYLPFYAPTIVEGKPIVHIQSNHFMHLQNRFENLIIGGFVGKMLPFGFVRETLTRTWNLKNLFIMKAYGESKFSFEFRSEEDRKEVLEMGSLHIASQLFILRPWKLFIEAEFSELKTIPIWVLMKKFPMELWDDEGFGRVANTIGTPLFVDNLIESMARTSYAR